MVKRSAENWSDARTVRVGVVLCLAVALQLAVIPGLQNPPFASDESPRGPLRLEVLRLTLEPSSGLLTRFNGKVSLQIRVTNQTDVMLMLDSSQLQLLCENTVCAHSRPSRPNLFIEKQRELPPGETLEGWVAFQVVRPSSQEPSLKFSWEVGDSTQIISLNQVLRDLVNASTEYVGYEKQIVILSIDRSIDLMTMWVLDEQFRALRKQGVERLVLQAAPEESTRLPPRISNWLQLANKTTVKHRRAIVRGFPAPVQFNEFHVTGFQYGSNTAELIMHRSREHAVAAAATTLYERLSVEAAAAEFDSPEFGIRRAALESSIDRLPAADLVGVLESVKSGYGAERQLLLEMLDRVSHPVGLQTLHSTLLSYLQSPPDMSESFAPATAAVAARTLVRCIVPRTDVVLNEVWAAANSDDSLQASIIDEVLGTHDHRWAQLAAEFATKQLDRFSLEQSGSDVNSDTSARTDTVSPLLRKVLRFLHHEDRAFIDVAQYRLLDVKLPEIQDELLRIVVDSGGTALARACITRRLEEGAITKALLVTIHQLPDSQWTSRLFELQGSEDLPSQYRASTLMTAVRCANDEQLDMIIDGVDNLDRTARTQLFQQLISMDHPRCAEMLAKSLDGNATEFSSALTTLRFGMSPEILQVVVDRYEVFRQAAIELGSLEGSAYRMATILLSRIGAIDHPEARRMINLSLISPERGLRDEAIRQLSRSNARSRTRAYGQKRDVDKLKRLGKYAEAKNLLNDLIAQDPFCTEFLVNRASLHLRDNQIEAARADVVEANRLNPGDVFTESTLALVMVRSGQMAAGLSQAELVMKQVPAAAVGYYQGTLYNTACTYSRALELPDLTDELRQQYLARAIELMQQSADAGFYDEAHVLKDPDLDPLHTHPEWPKIIDQIKTNAPKKEL